MSKMSEQQFLHNIASELRSCKDAFDNIADAIDEFLETYEAGEADTTGTVTLEEVRTVLAEKSRDGKTSKVRELLKSFGAEKLSEIDPLRYAEVLKAAEGI